MERAIREKSEPKNGQVAMILDGDELTRPRQPRTYTDGQWDLCEWVCRRCLERFGRKAKRRAESAGRQCSHCGVTTGVVKAADCEEVAK